DKNSSLFYVGRVLSRHVFYDESLLGGRCDFAHRRKVQWLCVLDGNKARSIWKGGRFGGQQTVSEVQTGLRRLRRFLQHPVVQQPRRVHKVPWHPDKEWGRLAE
ncbi:MAG: hypothetical protein WBW41_20575, partial [Verrucomicrobiia bacterium]